MLRIEAILKASVKKELGRSRHNLAAYCWKRSFEKPIDPIGVINVVDCLPDRGKVSILIVCFHGANWQGTDLCDRRCNC